MKISIVEDEAVWRDKIQAVIEKYCRDKNISFQINSYGSGKEFMKNADADLLNWQRAKTVFKQRNN